MGLLDFFSRSTKNSKHHYAFAHQALRRIAFAEPIRIFAVLSTAGRVNFFDELLSDVDSLLDNTERRNFSGRDIAFFGCTIAGRPCAILQMPAATNPAEAYFVAIVARYPLEELSSQVNGNGSTPLIDYYTLERPIEVTRKRQSVFCAWTNEDAHLNFGDGPSPTLEQFTSFLSSHVQRK